MMNICSQFDVFCNTVAYNVNLDRDAELLASEHFFVIFAVYCGFLALYIILT